MKFFIIKVNNLFIKARSIFEFYDRFRNCIDGFYMLIVFFINFMCNILYCYFNFIILYIYFS